MDEKSNRRWASLALLSIIVPVSLLATLRLTGLQPEPPPKESITLDTSAWSTVRPSDYEILDQEICAEYKSDLASLSFIIYVSSYTDDNPTLGDHIVLGTTSTGNLSSGFVHSLSVKFSELDDQAFLDTVADSDWIELRNLEIIAMQDSWDVEEPYIEALGLGRHQTYRFGLLHRWIFFDDNSAYHRIRIVFRITCFDGATSKEVISPAELEVLV